MFKLTHIASAPKPQRPTQAIHTLSERGLDYFAIFAKYDVNPKCWTI